MRRFLFGVVIASVTAAMPAWAFGGDREIAQAVMADLQQQKAAGNLKGFDIDLKVEDGVVYLTGQVATRAQRALVEQAAINEVGRANLVNELIVKGEEPESQANVPRPMVERSAVERPAVERPAVERPMMERSAVERPSMSRPTVARPVAEQPAKVPQTQLAPASASQVNAQPTASDVAITDSVITRLQQSKAAGALRGFDLDVSTVNGDVWVKGSVANQQQKSLVLDIARRTRGVARVVDDVAVKNATAIRQVSTGIPTPVPQVSSMPVANHPQAAPQPFAPSGLASVGVGGGYVSGGPVPMQGAGAEYGVGAPRYDQPNMPSYAWPSYAAYPNYSAVTYPKQYSPSAWPYIGPFYPYPQVPLGWRRASLEWDDGLWYLDFTSK